METRYNLTFDDIEALGLRGVAEGTPAMRNELEMLVQMGRVPREAASMLTRVSTTDPSMLTPSEAAASVVAPTVEPTVTAPPTAPTVSSAEPAANQSAGAPLVNSGLVDTVGGTPRQVVDQEAKQREQLRKRMLAAAAVKDAGFALMGKEGNAVATLLGAFNEQDDMSRKAEAAAARQEMLRNLGFGTTGGFLSGDVSTPEGRLAQRNAILQAMISEAIDPVTGAKMIEELNRLEGLASDASTQETGLDVVNALLQSDQLDQITGLKGKINSYLEGFGLAPEYSDLMSFVDQLDGLNFLQAFKSLRGGGQITEKESAEAKQAQARFKRAMKGTPEMLREALEETKAVFEKALRGNPTFSGALDDDESTPANTESMSPEALKIIENITGGS